MRVLVVDDHQAFRSSLVTALGLVRDVVVAGEAEDGEAAVAAALEVRPDVVLMDLSMPRLSGIEAMRRIHRHLPGLPVVIFTAHADHALEREALAEGAAAFVAKGAPLDELVMVLSEAMAEGPGEHAPGA